MDKFREDMKKLLKGRIINTEQLINEEALIKAMKESIIERELKIKIELEDEMANADQATIKTKYSNAEKRRLEAEKRLNLDAELSVLKSGLLEREKNLITLGTKEKILKLQERYLFKNIDLHIAELTTKEKIRCLEKVEKD
jgi:hypothetical protein